jgi:hypothetical protein
MLRRRGRNRGCGAAKEKKLQHRAHFITAFCP